MYTTFTLRLHYFYISFHCITFALPYVLHTVARRSCALSWITLVLYTRAWRQSKCSRFGALGRAPGGPKRVPRGPQEGSKRAPRAVTRSLSCVTDLEVLLGASRSTLGAVLDASRGPRRSRREPRDGSRGPESGHAKSFLRDRCCGSLGCLSGRVRHLWGRLWALLGRLGALLGALWTVLERSWGTLWRCFSAGKTKQR